MQILHDKATLTVGTDQLFMIRKAGQAEGQAFNVSRTRSKKGSDAHQRLRLQEKQPLQVCYSHGTARYTSIFLSLLVHVMQRLRMLLLFQNASCCIRWQ